MQMSFFGLETCFAVNEARGPRPEARGPRPEARGPIARLQEKKAMLIRKYELWVVEIIEEYNRWEAHVSISYINARM